MSSKKEQLEEAMNRFLKDQNRETQDEMLRLAINYVFFVPGMFPPGTNPKDMMPKNPGEKVNIPPDKRPFPAVIKNSNGEFFIPAYLDQAIIKSEPKPEAILQIPFMALADLAVRNQQMTGVAINPFTQNILLKRAGLEALLADMKRQQAQRAGAAKQMVKPKAPEKSVLYSFLTETMPEELYKDSRVFMERLEKEEGAFLLETAEKAGKTLKAKEEDFSVMALNIRDALTLIRLDVPQENRTPKVQRSYLLLNEDGGNTAIYTVEMLGGEDGRKIFYTNPKGGRNDICEAPTEGVEMSKVLELYDALFPEGVRNEVSEG